MTYSYTQINHYIACPRRCRYLYLEGWEEKETRAAMMFGRAFEKALAAGFLGEDSHNSLNSEWAAVREVRCEYRGDGWAHMLDQGHRLLDVFRAQDRVQVPDPGRHLQVRVLRPLPGGNGFVGFIAAHALCSAELTSSSHASTGLIMNGTFASWIWGVIYARCGPGSTGVSSIWARLTSSWNAAFPIRGARPII